MFQQSFQLGRKVRELRQFRLQHFQLDDHMTEQLSAGGVGKRAHVGQLVDFSDVVKKGAGEQQVTVDLRIVAAHQVAGPEQRDHVIEQAADIGVMQSLGGGGVAVGGGDFGVSHESLHQRAQVWVLERTDEVTQRPPEFVDVSAGLGQIVGEIDFRIGQAL